MLSSAKKSVPTTKQFIEPYFIEIAPGGAVIATCPRFSTLLFKKNIYSFLGKNVLDVFALLGVPQPAISPSLFDKDQLPVIDLPVQRSGMRSFVIRWLPTPLRGMGGEAEGWQLTGMRMDANPDLPEVKEMCVVTQELETAGTAGLIRYVSDIVVTTDPQGRILYWNLAAEKLYDIPAKEAMGRSFPDLIHHVYADCTEEVAMQTLNKQGFWEGERSYVSDEGKKSYLISSIRYVRDSGRRITGIMTLSRDITENKIQQQDRKKAEMQLRLYSDQITGILESITDGFFVLDQYFRVTLWNDEAERITRVPAAEMTGQIIWERLPQLVDTDTQQSFHKAFKKKMTVTFEKYNSHFDRWLEMSVYPSRQGLFAYFKDVTVRKQQEAMLTLEKRVLEQEMNKQKLIAQAMVDAQEKERAEIGKELHDNINQILSTTKLYLELAKNDTKERLNLINRSAGNIHIAIHEIRNISRSLVPASIGDLGLIDSLTDLVESVSTTRALHVEFYPVGNFDSTIDDKIKLMLFRIIQEQINNVLKHSGARNLIIELVLEETENVIELNITDDGKGFDPAGVHKKGLGLSNIVSRADLFGGKVTIVSAPGQGCQLKVSVPL